MHQSTKYAPTDVVVHDDRPDRPAILLPCRMDLKDAIAWITADADEMAALLTDAEPDQPVPACPGWNAADLSRHVAVGFSAWYPYNISTPAPSWTPEGLMARIATVTDDHQANVEAFRAGATEFTTFCAELDLDEPTWSFGAVRPAGWWVRRAAVELTVHLTDAAGVHGRRSSTTPERHAEAIDEVTTEMYPRLAAVKATMNALSGGDSPAPDAPDRPAALVTNDTDRAWTLARAADGTASVTRELGDDVQAVGRGSSADVLAWLHGRPMTTTLTIEGDAALLDDWNLFQRSQF